MIDEKFDKTPFLVDLNNESTEIEMTPKYFANGTALFYDPQGVEYFCFYPLKSKITEVKADYIRDYQGLPPSEPISFRDIALTYGTFKKIRR